MNQREAIVSIKALKSPSAVLTTGSFKIEILDAAGNLLAESVMDLILDKDIFKPGQLLLAQVLPSNQTVGAANAIIIQMQMRNLLELKSAPYLKVRIPRSLELGDNCKVEVHSAP